MGGTDSTNTLADARGEGSFAFGALSGAASVQAFGDYSLAFGRGGSTGTTPTVANGDHSFAFGRDANAARDYTLAFGQQINALSFHEIVFGSRNTFVTGSANSCLLYTSPSPRDS